MHPRVRLDVDPLSFQLQPNLDEQPLNGGGEEIVQPLPSFAQMSANIAGSMTQFARNGFRTVDKQTHEARLSVCRPCPRYSFGRCTTCGCFVELKAKMGHEECPEGHWGH